MKLSSILFLTPFVLPSPAKAHPAYAPPDFEHAGGRAVFVDIQGATAEVEYDGARKSAVARTTLTFLQDDEGSPLFDLVPEPSRVRIDGVETSQELVKTPGGATQYRKVAVSLAPGLHTLEVDNEIGTDVDFRSGGVASAFFFIDWHDRSYLEQYLPTNAEYDQYPLTLTLRFANTDKGSDQHDVFANGRVTRPDARSARIEFPAFYNCASFYLHVAPQGQFTSQTGTYRSVDGRELPVITFKKNASVSLPDFQKRAAEVLGELEADYGPFPHDQVVIYADYGGGKPGLGGMEYAGATITALSALDHELFHSYHGRSMAPADGNSGWMDEAIASWRDEGYQSRAAGSPIVTNMAGRDTYIRYIGMEPYRQGEQFMRHLEGKAQTQGRSMKAFLRDYFERRKYTIVTTTVFRKDLEAAIGLPLGADFDAWVYGRAHGSVTESFMRPAGLHPKHLLLTPAERGRLL